MASAPNRRAVRWLQGELPVLVESGAISADNARAIEAHYAAQGKSAPNFGFVLLATIGSSLVAAGIILLIAHNWDEFSRPLRSVLAFLPLLAAQALTAFVLLRRDESKAWRESAAIFNVATIGTAISLVSQTYQIHGSLANFILVWMLLSLPLVYLLRTTLGAIAYLIGAMVWLLIREKMRGYDPIYFWLLLLLIIPYFAALYRRARDSRETAAFAIVLVGAVAMGLAFTADFSGANFGVLAFGGFFALVYLCGIEFFSSTKSDGLHPLALLGGIAIGVMTIVLTFEAAWRNAGIPLWPADVPHALAVAIELAFPLVALALGGRLLLQGRVRFSVLAMAFPLVVTVGWLMATQGGLRLVAAWSGWDLAGALLLNAYALALGIELIARGLRADSIARSNFGLLIIAGLAIARFFDSDLAFVVRAVGFIVIGLGFLATNFLLFRKRRAA